MWMRSRVRENCARTVSQFSKAVVGSGKRGSAPGRPRRPSTQAVPVPVLMIGCIEYAGVNPRAPAWMQRYGLEWMFRLSNEPRRLLWRYVWTNLVSGVLLLFFSRRQSIPMETSLTAAD